MKWKDKPNGWKTSAILDVIEDDPNNAENHYWWRASIKWDGCIHLFSAYNNPYILGENDNKHPDQSYFHICDLNDLIERLLDLKRMAIEHFGEDWVNQ